jgi:hypothetical protein
MSLEDLLAMEGLEARIQRAATMAVEAVGRPEVDIEAIVARVRAEVAQDLTPLEEAIADIPEQIQEALPEPEPGPAPDPAPDEPAQETPATPEPESPTEDTPPAPEAHNAEPETQAPARHHFLHGRIGGKGKAA